MTIYLVKYIIKYFVVYLIVNIKFKITKLVTFVLTKIIVISYHLQGGEVQTSIFLKEYNQLWMIAPVPWTKSYVKFVRALKHRAIVIFDMSTFAIHAQENIY